MKGKTNDPLNLLVDSGLYDTPEVQALIEQGHTITAYIPLEYGRIDGLLGATMWRMTPELLKYLPMAIKAIRKERTREGSKDRKAKQPKKAASRAKKGSTDNSATSVPAGGERGDSSREGDRSQ
jgi:hypothetical protein